MLHIKNKTIRGYIMGRSAITCDNQSRIIHALSSLAPHLDVCADVEKQCVYIQKSQDKECDFILRFLGKTPDKPLFGNIENNEISLDAIDISWLEEEARRHDPAFTPLHSNSTMSSDSNRTYH
jgi:hypothetical protein